MTLNIKEPKKQNHIVHYFKQNINAKRALYRDLSGGWIWWIENNYKRKLGFRKLI